MYKPESVLENLVQIITIMEFGREKFAMIEKKIKLN